MPTSAPAPEKRPRAPSLTKSFSRYEPGRTSAPSRSRATTLSDEMTAPQLLSSYDEPDELPADPLQRPPVDSEQQTAAASSQSLEIDRFPAGFDQLPVELASLTDRFIASLTTAKIYATPPSIDKLSELFQEFYLQAEAHISTHIQELSSRRYRDASPAPSTSSRSSNRAKSTKDGQEKPEKMVPEQQMLTSDEINERRKSRKLLEHKKLALEEAVEKRVCEKIYDRIWRHRSTLDEIRDDKLGSRTAGLAVVGVSLKDLGVDLDLTPDAEDWIFKAQSNLLDMDKAHFPLGKLQSLAAAHQDVVEWLTASHQGSSSADEILPALIYVLITAKETSGLISNLNFIQRFRTASKMNGEAAYCLTNLEAAITFLETVDLATLRDEKEPQAASHASKVSKIPTEYPKAQPTMTDGVSGSSSAPQQVTKSTRAKSSSSLTIDIKAPHSVSPAAPSPSNRLSTLFQPPAALGAAGDAVRNTADEGIRNIGSALDKSFSFMFGRLKEQDADASKTVTAPKTLDEARRLVSPKAMAADDGTLSDHPLPIAHEDRMPKEDQLLDVTSGTHAARDRSADSAASGSSAKRLRSNSKTHIPGASAIGVSPPISASGAVESVKNLGSSLNRFASMNMMKGFGRAASSPTVATHSTVAHSSNGPLSEQDNVLEVNIEPPIQRLLDIKDPQDLQIRDVALLLKEYQRLAAFVKMRGLV